MINKELELTVNSQNILDKLARNLNIGIVTDNSNIKKIADAFDAELRNYSDATENAIANGFLSTMDDDLFELFASDFGLYRKRYNRIRLRPIEQVAILTVDQAMLFTQNYTNFTPFRKGDVVYSNDTFSIIALADIYFSSTIDNVYPHLEIVLRDTTSTFVINEGTEFTVSTKQSDLRSNVPTYTLKFEQVVGMSLVEENINDFKLRVYEATYLAANSANSLVNAVTKEVPYLVSIETDDVSEGRALKVIYPYTQNLIDFGVDTSIQNIVIPMIESSLNQKGLYKNMITVKEAIPLRLSVEINTGDIQIADTVLYQTTQTFNSMFYNQKIVTMNEVKSFIIQNLSTYKLKASDINIYFASSLFSEDKILMSPDENLSIPIGRFLNISTITGVSNG